MLRVAAVLLPFVATVSAEAVFKALPNCHSPISSAGCQYTAGATDEIVSLFFQYEPSGSEASGGFSCVGEEMVYCERGWMAEASGSAGDCFFMLGSGRSFSCSGNGTVNLIGAHAAATTAKSIASGEGGKQLGCKGGAAEKCAYQNGAADLWVSMALTSQTNATAACRYEGMEVCSWRVNSAGGSTSCNFLLPSKASLTCTGTAKVTASAGLAFAESVLDVAAEIETAWNCPNVTYPENNLCDCAYTNPHTDKDLFVSVSTQSVDQEYNSFHCGYGAVNVCAWGDDRNDLGDGGSCYFIVPAGETFSCQMEWGSTAFSFSKAVLSRKTLFGPAGVKGRAHMPAAKATVPPVPTNDELVAVFAQWKREHTRTYASAAEEAQRFANFKVHVALAGQKPRYNGLADLSVEEFETKYKGCGRAPVRSEADAVWTPTSEEARAVPESFDWRTKGMVTPVKNQAQCGSCWSFSTTGSIESAWAIAGHPLVSLSEQDLVSCDNKDGNDGCGGGWPYRAVDYIAKNGIATEASYPYVSGTGKVPACTKEGHVKADAAVTGHYNVASNESAMAAYVTSHGPLSITVDAMTQLWWPYTGGIMKGCCNKANDHAVLIVGFGVDAGTKYWTIKNSWDTTWGEKGYLRLERDSDQCGIKTDPMFPLMQGVPGPPTPAPTPVGTCPSPSVTRGRSCIWVNGTNGVVMPSASLIQPDCTYFSSGYFSYLWPLGTGNASCPTGASLGSSSEDHFCTFTNHEQTLNWPAGSRAVCGNLTKGEIGYAW